jgi:hypothetical protein
MIWALATFLKCLVISFFGVIIGRFIELVWADLVKWVNKP